MRKMSRETTKRLTIHSRQSTGDIKGINSTSRHRIIFHESKLIALQMNGNIMDK